MAGIGFVLRKLLRKDELTSMSKAYFHAVISTSGPWIFTVIALGSIYLLTKHLTFFGFVSEFRIIVLYNFCFSLVFSAPFAVVATRCLSDGIYERDLKEGLGILVCSLAASSLVSLPFVLWFYGYYTIMDPMIRLAAIANFYLVMFIWIITVFVSTLRYYKAVTGSYFAGMVLAVFGSVALADDYQALGMLVGFNIGLSLIVAVILGVLMKEYPPRWNDLTCFYKGMRKYWMYALGAFFFALGIWVDKWVMWFSPDAVRYPNNMIVYPYYDSALFVAYLTVIPSMAMFMLRQETDFFEEYVDFYRNIMKGANFTQIRQHHESLYRCILRNGSYLLIMQAFTCIVVILAAPKIFEWIGMNVIQLGMFRYGVIGAMFQVLVLFLGTLMAYFEHRRGLLAVQCFFFVSNGILTAVVMQFGFPYYGYGYFLAGVITFLFAAVVAERFIRNLPYHTFITTNASINT
ncbi:MAG: exopolysaccharide Pel transporter PelG [Chlamydiales bacterium]|nr:exopolysaccharide Pel transporter PelG [Chlamydiia bacterium]MCP5508371.1 exopolysaccharide Pel transporter PelG [Chlamydiales bacterium]